MVGVRLLIHNRAISLHNLDLSDPVLIILLLVLACENQQTRLMETGEIRRPTIWSIGIPGSRINRRHRYHDCK
jgi:hypothetical protein